MPKYQIEIKGAGENVFKYRKQKGFEETIAGELLEKYKDRVKFVQDQIIDYVKIIGSYDALIKIYEMIKGLENEFERSERSNIFEINEI